MTTYIHGELEVKPTGRTASKKRTRSSRNKEQMIIMHEVKPVDEKIDMLSWVILDELFQVDPNQ